MTPQGKKRLKTLMRNKGAMAGLVMLVILIGCSVFAPLVSPHGPKDRISSPLGEPQGENLMGTDELGRDLMSRVFYGGRISLSVGFISVGISLLVGGVLGLVTGYVGGKTDLLLMRIMDIMLAFPSILLAILVVNIFDEPGLGAAMTAVGIVGIPIYTRIVRGSVLAEKARDYVVASKAMGASGGRIIWQHIFPNVTAPLIVQVTLGFGSAILDAAGLSFLGLGAQDPQIEWGLMVNQGRELYSSAWWVILFPGLAIFLAVLGFNLLGDGLREALDPRSQK